MTELSTQQERAAQDFEDLKAFALVAFLCDYGCNRLLELDDEIITQIGVQAGLDPPRTVRCMAAMFQIYAAKRDEVLAWIKRNTN